MLVKSEIARWTPILQAANVEVEQAGRYREGILIFRFATPAAECPVRTIRIIHIRHTSRRPWPMER